MYVTNNKQTFETKTKTVIPLVETKTHWVCDVLNTMGVRLN